MASIRKRGSNSYLIVVSRGYDYEGNRLKSVQKTVKPPKEYTPKQAEKWVKEQAILFEREVQHTPEPINRSITLAKYIEHWVTDVGPKKLADSTFRRDEQDIRRILPALGNYKLTDLRKEVIRDFYEEMRHSPRLDGRGNLSEKSVEGLHNTLCGILSAAVDEGYLTHNPAWRCYKPKGQKKERPVADEETVKKLITAFEGQSMKYETYFKLVLATGLRRGEACGLRWSDINWRKRTIHVQRGVVTPSNSQRDDTPNNKTHVIKFRVTAEEKTSLELTCKLLNLSLSTFIRRAIHNVKIEKTVIVAGGGEETLTAVSTLLAQCSKVGTNLNQLARHFNSGGADTEQIRAKILDELADLTAFRLHAEKVLGELYGNAQAYKL